MRGDARRIKRGIAALAFVFAAALPGAARAADCLLLQLNKPDAAELKVYFTKFPQEDTTKGAYKACKIVSKPTPGAKTFFVTPFRQDANVVVHRSNWP